MFTQTTIGGCIAGGMIWASIAALIWFPLSASWRQSDTRRRRFSAAVVLAASAVFLGVSARQLMPAPVQGAFPVLIWFLGFQGWSLILLVVVTVTNRLRSGAWWSHAGGDSPGDRRLWAMIPAITCFIAAAVLGLTNVLFLLSADRLVRANSLAAAAVSFR